MTGRADNTIEIYRRHAAAFDRQRDRSLFEKAWLDRFISAMPDGRRILDIGCGTGEPIAAYLARLDCRLTGIDTSPAMLAMGRTRMPDHQWIEADMRDLQLGRRFDGLIAFGSFFFLEPDEQRAMFAVFAAHAEPGGALLFASGPDEGPAWGEFEGEALYHASLSPDEYRRLLDGAGFDVIDFVPDDPDCAGHCMWLAKRRYEQRY